MRAYSTDLRLRILNAYLSGDSSQREIARRFDVSRSFVQKLIRRYRQTGVVDTKPQGRGAPAKVDSEGRQILKAIVARNPDATLNKLCGDFARRTGVEVSISTMHRALKQLST